jgi:hypothetical protein
MTFIYSASNARSNVWTSPPVRSVAVLRYHWSARVNSCELMLVVMWA